MECSALRSGLSFATYYIYVYIYIYSMHPLVLSFCLCATGFRQISLLTRIQTIQSIKDVVERTYSSHMHFALTLKDRPEKLCWKMKKLNDASFTSKCICGHYRN